MIKEHWCINVSNKIISKQLLNVLAEETNELLSGGILQKQCFQLVLELPRLSQSEKVTLEVEKVYEVCNEVSPDILLGLCCIGL